MNDETVATMLLLILAVASFVILNTLPDDSPIPVLTMAYTYLWTTNLLIGFKMRLSEINEYLFLISIDFLATWLISVEDYENILSIVIGAYLLVSGLSTKIELHLFFLRRPFYR